MWVDHWVSSSPQQRRDVRKSIALSAKPRATDVNSFPPRIRFFPNRVSKIFLTAGTNEEPPVRKTILTSLCKTPEQQERIDAACDLFKLLGNPLFEECSFHYRCQIHKSRKPEGGHWVV